ncbi:putative Translocator protein like protein [Venustampulla echinocandica]|uniref:Putative Translocator protein like protein n=1 Tax=Venustampulla echinocandica TaxID=2656787 RepID=A0A370TSS3_9HELO|nr:putative Translocator protein like protein [Venustampulla echinocandica]RDL38582.1 putative Translocator protein like protein [Venustampulla echinocandica]
MTTFIPSITIPAAVFANPAASILLPVALGTAVGFSVRPTDTQKTYLALKQPPYRPPPEVFGPAWTVLYGLMGYSAYRAYSVGMSPFASTEKHLLVKHGATLYTIQLGLNLMWMPLFFWAKRPIEASVDIVALTGVTGYLTYLWAKVDTVAGLALAPYLGWLGYATYLSLGVGYLNGWDFNDKVVDASPSTKDSKWVDEKGN